MENIFASSNVRLSKEVFECGLEYKNTYENQMSSPLAINEKILSSISVIIMNEEVVCQSLQLQRRSELGLEQENNCAHTPNPFFPFSVFIIFF